MTGILYGDSVAIAGAVEDASDTGELISDACARVIASQWHSSNAGASFSTSGAIVCPPAVLWAELFTLRGRPVEFETEWDAQAAEKLRAYLEAAGQRGMVAGWSDLWLEPERVDLEGDWLHCLCGNQPHRHGFDVSSPDGESLEGDRYGEWDGIHYLCLNCGRVIDQNTLQVTARVGTEGI